MEGTAGETRDRAMRQEVSTSGLAILDGATLPTKHGHAGSAPVGAVIREYQSDSSSKKPLRPLVFSTPTPEGRTKSHEMRTSSLDRGHSISAQLPQLQRK